jgi:cold shock CspA family protein
VRKDQKETYESVYKVLDELEVLLKVWRKRTEHVFTAHIQKSGREGAAAAGGTTNGQDDDSSMRFGVDYSDSDMAHESDDDDECEYAGGGPGGGGLGGGAGEGAEGGAVDGPEGVKLQPNNEALSKKKFCQSTRIYHSIFDGGSAAGGGGSGNGSASERQFDSFYSFVHRAKKHIHSIIYSLFIDALPEECSSRLPRELWEKIWKHTQSPYDENNTYNCGYRFAASAENKKYFELEKNRVMDLFGAAGNFHMFIFEILYKHPYITQTPAMMELESVDTKDSSKSGKKPSSYVKTRFQRYKRLFERAFSRLLDLQHQPIEASNSNSSEENGESELKSKQSQSLVKDTLSHVQKINRGLFTCRKQNLSSSYKNSNRRELNCDFYGESLANGILITPSSSCSVVAMLDGHVQEDGQSYLNFVIWNVFRKSVVAYVRTGVTLLQAVYGKNCNAPFHLFDLTENRFAFLLRSTDENGEILTAIYHWQFDPDSMTPVELLGTDPETVIECKPFPEPAKATGDGGTVMSVKYAELGAVEKRPVYILSHGELPGEATSTIISFYDATTGKEIKDKKIVLAAAENVCIECVRGNRAIARNGVAKTFIVLDLDNGNVMAEYKYIDLCKHADHGHKIGEQYQLECVYEVKMDQDPKSNQFVIFSQNMASFQLFEFSKDDNAPPPKVVRSGSTLVYEMSWRMLGKVSLYRGVLYAAPTADIEVRAHCGDFFDDHNDVRSVDLFAFDLTDYTLHPIINMIERGDDTASGGGGGSNNRAFAYSANDNEKVLMNEHSRFVYADSSNYRCPFFAGADFLVLSMRQSYVEVIFHRDARNANEADADELFALHNKREKLKKKEGEIAEKKKRDKEDRAAKRVSEEKAAKTKLANNEQIHKGRVKRWEYSHGFLEATDSKDAKKAGGIFVHISEFKNRGNKRIRVGQRVTFKVVSQDKGRVKAVNVNFVGLSTAATGAAAAAAAAAQQQPVVEAPALIV